MVCNEERTYMKPTIGITESGKPLAIDIDKLLLTRMLLQADSGGGKTVALKRILEQTHGHVQQIIIDPEGEFSTLREKFDYLLCAPEGADAIANPKTAPILARKLRETRVSAVIDIYDLRPQEQKHFVRLFVEELLAAPKNLWNPCLLIIDEAQVFAPEGDKAESLGAIMDLRGRGRKRGLCPILATPRLAELSKDACAGLQNKLIGVTTLDLDVKRAARDLALTPIEATTLLRNLEPGEFFCFGPALTRKITKVKIGKITTSHGQHLTGKDKRPPAPSEKIKAVLAKLADLPKEAEQEAKTLADFKAENARLKRELTMAKQAAPKAPATKVTRIEVPVIGKRAIAGIQEAAKQMNRTLSKSREMYKGWGDALVTFERETDALMKALDRVANSQNSGTAIGAIQNRAVTTHSVTIAPKPYMAQKPSAPVNQSAVHTTRGAGVNKVLTAIAQHQDGVTRDQITVLTGYKRSSRDTYLQRLKQEGAIEFRGDLILATDHGVMILGPDFQPLPTGDELRRYWMDRLPEGEKKILNHLIGIYPNFCDRQTMDDATGYKRSSRDTYLQRLRSRQLIEASGVMVRASERLFT